MPKKEIETDSVPFSWDDEDNIIVRRKYGIAVYENTMDGIVIRYENPYPFEDDVVVINKDDAETVISAIQALLD